VRPARINYVGRKIFAIMERNRLTPPTRVAAGADRAHGARPEKILEETRSRRTLFFRQEKFFQDLFDLMGQVGGD
jgi:hypothetical protein